MRYVKESDVNHALSHSSNRLIFDSLKNLSVIEAIPKYKIKEILNEIKKNECCCSGKGDGYYDGKCDVYRDVQLLLGKLLEED